MLVRTGLLGGLATAVALLLVSVAQAGVAALAASGRGLMVTGPDPYNLDRTQPVEGSLAIRAPGFPAAAPSAGAIADLTAGGVRYRVVAETLSARWARRDDDPRPMVGPRLVAWGPGRVYRNAVLAAARAPVIVTVFSDAPLRGVSLEVATNERSLPGFPYGYLHVMWWDGDWPPYRTSARR